MSQGAFAKDRFTFFFFSLDVVMCCCMVHNLILDGKDEDIESLLFQLDF
jgi:hypothetical protein